MVLELPVFGMDQGEELARHLAGQGAAPANTLVRLVPCAPRSFYKDGVLVSPAGDRINAGVKATECGCLYWFKADNACWPHHGVGPEQIVWRRARPDWCARQARHDWTTAEADRPEVAPWLRKEAA